MGRANRGEQRLGVGRQFDQCVRRFHILHHDGERFLLAILPLAQRTDSGDIPGIAGQVIAAESFHRDNLSLAQEFDGASNRRSPPCCVVPLTSFRE